MGGHPASPYYGPTSCRF